MDQILFAKFGEEKYSLNIHTNRALKAVFEYLWVPFVFLIILFLVIAVVSIALAGEITYVIDITVRMFLTAGLTEGEYCNTSSSHAAACMILYNFGVILPFLIVLGLAAYLITALSKEVPQIFLENAKFGRIKNRNKLGEFLAEQGSDEENTKSGLISTWANVKQTLRIKPRNSLTYSDDFEAALISPWRFILFGFWLLLGYVFAIRMMEEVGLQYAGLPILTVAGYFFVTIFPIIVAYFVTAWIWFFFVVGYYLRWLPKIFKLGIQPNHGDHCGGLKRLGDICFKMALSITLPAILLGVWVATGSVEKVSVAIPTFTPFFFFAIVFLSVLSFLAFFSPVLGIHNAMTKAKKHFQDESIAKILVIETQIRQLYEDEEYDRDEMDKLLEKLKVTKTLYPTDIRYPTWPFSTQVFLGFFTTLIVPVLGAITLIVEFIQVLK